MDSIPVAFPGGQDRVGCNGTSQWCRMGFLSSPAAKLSGACVTQGENYHNRFDENQKAQLYLETFAVFPKYAERGRSALM